MKYAFADIIEGLGLDEKCAALYEIALSIGEGTIQQIAKQSGVKRTSLYYIIPELIKKGLLIEAKRNGKTVYIAEHPSIVLQQAKEKLAAFEDILPDLEQSMNSVYARSRVQLAYGTTGFKHVWDLLFKTGAKEYCITTQGHGLLEFVKERYIVEQVIKNKKKLGMRSRHLIVDSPYAQKILEKDKLENRTSKILPRDTGIKFTEVICGKYTVFISPRIENTILIIENEEFAKSRQAVFDLIWKLIK